MIRIVVTFEDERGGMSRAMVHDTAMVGDVLPEALREAGCATAAGWHAGLLAHRLADELVAVVDAAPDRRVAARFDAEPDKR